MHFIAKIVLKIIGWRAIYNLSPEIKKFVVIGAPHTANMDGLVSISALFYWKIKFKFMMKKEMFVFPLGPIFRACGGLAVDRSKKTSLTDQVVEYFDKSDSLILGITPEGTRSYNPNWKKGFYYITEKANVPLVLGYIDYKEKVVCIDKVFDKSGDVDADILRIKEYYKGKTGKYPEKGVH